MREFRQSLTTRCRHDYAYELGREWAHRLTFRIYDAPQPSEQAQSDTPRTDAEAVPWEEASFLGSKEVVSASFARELERELASAKAR